MLLFGLPLGGLISGFCWLGGLACPNDYNCRCTIGAPSIKIGDGRGYLVEKLRFLGGKRGECVDNLNMSKQKRTMPVRKYTSPKSSRFGIAEQKRVFRQMLKHPDAASQKMPELDWKKIAFVDAVKFATSPAQFVALTQEERIKYGVESCDLASLKAQCRYPGMTEALFKLDDEILGYSPAGGAHGDAVEVWEQAYSEYWAVLLRRFDRIMRSDRLQAEILRSIVPDAVGYFTEGYGRIDRSVIEMQRALGQGDFKEWACLRVVSGIANANIMPFVLSTRQMTKEAIKNQTLRVGGTGELSNVAFLGYLGPYLELEDAEGYVAAEESRREALKRVKKEAQELRRRSKALGEIEKRIRDLETSLTFSERVRASLSVEGLRRVSRGRPTR